MQMLSYGLLQPNGLLPLVVVVVSLAELLPLALLAELLPLALLDELLCLDVALFEAAAVLLELPVDDVMLLRLQ